MMTGRPLLPKVACWLLGCCCVLLAGTVRAQEAPGTASEARLSGHWFDSRGLVLSLAAEAFEDRLVTDWTAPSESGRTTYRIVDDDTVEVIDEVRSDEGLREFARATYRRR